MAVANAAAVAAEMECWLARRDSAVAVDPEADASIVEYFVDVAAAGGRSEHVYGEFP